jgi:mono/diheme cytochrome c family protein
MLRPQWLVALCLVSGPAWGQDRVADDIRQGRDLAIKVCAYCHIAARDQPFKPILQPPASSLESIAQRKTTTADSLRVFITTTHRGLDKPKGMPSLELLEDQVRQVAAYILSLRKQP